MNIDLNAKNHKISKFLKSLRDKLNNFQAQFASGEIIGQVKDLRLGEYGRIHLVILPLNRKPEARLLLINSRSIEKIDWTNQLIKVKDDSQFEQPPKEVKVINEAEVGDRALEHSQKREIAEEKILRLLEERLIIDRSKQKVGEIIVRKAVETRLVQVPVRREKLIVEQVGEPNKQLAEVELGAGEVSGVEIVPSQPEQPKPTVKGEFFSPKAASDLLKAIALEKPHGCDRVRIEITLNEPKLQKTYQEMFDRCIGK